MRHSLALTFPTDEARSTRRVLGRFLKKQARDALALRPVTVVPELRPIVSRVQGLIRGFGEGNPAPLYQVLRRTHVHGLLTCAWRALADEDPDAAAERTATFFFQVLVELSLDGALPEPVTWPGPPPGGVVSSGTHRVHVAGLDTVAQVEFQPASIRLGQELELPGAAEPSPLFLPVAPGMVLSLVDNNPISDFEAHPDKEGNQLDLGGAPADTWVTVLQESLALIGAHMPELREEMDLFLQRFIPVGTDEHSHLSASYREFIGTMYLTLHPQSMTMTEALIHEYQHSKINLLFHLDPVMDNAYWPLYPSPVRPDPRPLHGVLLAAHAFVPVAELYKRLSDAGAPQAQRGGFRERFGQILAKNDEAMQVLEAHAQPSASGRQVIDELATMHEGHLALGV